MGWTSIPVRDEVYERLRARKRPGERFSDLLDRLGDRETGFDAGFGAMDSVDFESALEELDDRRFGDVHERR